jgi:GNAT superfamily N-acetyltransferase
MKPPALCQPSTPAQLEWEARHFGSELAARGLRCRPATTTTDAYCLWRFLTNCFLPVEIEPMPVMDRIVRHGYALMIEDIMSGRPIAAQIAEHYADGTVQALRYAVDPLYRKEGLSAKLVLQHAVDCMERGGVVRRGMVDLGSPDALASLTVLVNHLGCVVDGCETYLYGEDHTVLTVEVPLTPRGLVESRIDQAAAKEWLLSVSPHDYTLLSPSAPKRIAEVYRTSNHRIVAVLPGGALLAVPVP